MNKLYAFYCRAYQAVFRAALPILPYREPIQLDGLSSIVPLLAEKRIASALLVTDASVRSLGLTSGLEAALKAAGCNDLSRAVMVGDREHDVIGAHLAGFDVIGVLYGYGSREELTAAGADQIAETPEALETLILSTN